MGTENGYTVTRIVGGSGNPDATALQRSLSPKDNRDGQVAGWGAVKKKQVYAGHFVHPLVQYFRTYDKTKECLRSGLISQ